MERTVAGPAGDLRVDDEGSGEPAVLFLHGLAGALEVWTLQLMHLRWTRRAAALDLRGMGQSASPRDGDFSLRAMAADVNAAADALGLSRFVLVAHCWAGAVAGTYAALHPERLAGLVLVEAGGDLRAKSASELEHLRDQLHHNYRDYTVDWFGRLLVGAAPHTVNLVLRQLRQTRPSSVVAALEEGLSYDPREALAHFPGPKLAVVAEQFAYPHSVENEVPGFDVRRVRGASHWLMLDRPAELNGHLDWFLASLPLEQRPSA